MIKQFPLHTPQPTPRFLYGPARAGAQHCRSRTSLLLPDRTMCMLVLPLTRLHSVRSSTQNKIVSAAARYGKSDWIWREEASSEQNFLVCNSVSFKALGQEVRLSATVIGYGKLFLPPGIPKLLRNNIIVHLECAESSHSSRATQPVFSSVTPWPLSPPSRFVPPSKTRLFRKNHCSSRKYRVNHVLFHFAYTILILSCLYVLNTNSQTYTLDFNPVTTNPKIRCHALVSAASDALLGEHPKQSRRNGIRRHLPPWHSPCRGTYSTRSSYQRPGVRHPQAHRPAMPPLLVLQLL